MLKSSILPGNFPKMGVSGPKFSIPGRKFTQKKIIFRGGTFAAILPTTPLIGLAVSLCYCQFEFLRRPTTISLHQLFV